ncbi:MAG: hypothetical protein NWF06_10235 [Candidatus Bathyarchaeota archaeon]|nr:hypothetical protein [Candidatus Bathyarchaeum sp.]
MSKSCEPIKKREYKIIGKLKKHISSFFGSLKPSRKTLLLVVIVAIVSIASSTLISVLLIHSNPEIYVPSLGTIKTIEVEAYEDANCGTAKEMFDWGELMPGNISTQLVYIKSVSNFVVTLNLNLTDWSPPEISEYITITWDYNGTTLKPNDVIPIAITISVSSSDGFINYLVHNQVTQFNVDLHFIASE